MHYSNSLCFITFLIFILFLYFLLKKIDISNIEKFTITSALLLSLKVFWNCDIQFYGVYFIPILIIGLFLLLKHFQTIYKTSVIFFIILLVIIFINNVCIDRKISSFKIKVNTKASLYSFLDTSYKTKRLINYIKNNTKADDKVVIYPEGIMFNYISERPAEIKYYSMLPPYFQLYEKNMINYYKKNKPKLFILINDSRTLQLYGYKELCKDYAASLCKFIKDNYTLEETLYYLDDDSEPFYIYKRK